MVADITESRELADQEVVDQGWEAGVEEGEWVGWWRWVHKRSPFTL